VVFYKVSVFFFFIKCNGSTVVNLRLWCFLQDYVDEPKDEPDLCTRIWVPSSHDGNQGIGIKVEEPTDIKVKEDPDTGTFQTEQTESEVGCMCDQVFATV
jgi:hypothetical protein